MDWQWDITDRFERWVLYPVKLETIRIQNVHRIYVEDPRPLLILMSVLYIDTHPFPPLLNPVCSIAGIIALFPLIATTTVAIVI